LETLESAKAQTYQNIELIISDDCSPDNTVEICRNWLEKNGERFVRAELITIEKNTGVSANCNRGLFAANGEWVKFIAGDDVMTNDSIQLFIAEIKSNKDIKFLFASTIPFERTKEYLPIFAPNEFIEANAFKQNKLLLKKGNCILGPTSIIHRKSLNDLGGFDERIPFQEDYPLWIKVTSNGFKLYFINFISSKYRIHEDSLTSSSVLGIRNSVFDEMKYKTLDIYILPNLLKRKMYLYFWHRKITYLKEKNNETSFLKFLLKSTYLINPVGLFQKIKSICGIEVHYNFKYIENKNR
jgi:alpha-1,3-rhamnosyltransferase